jgi:hypothetical protein
MYVYACNPNYLGEDTGWKILVPLDKRQDPIKKNKAKRAGEMADTC